MNVIEGSLGEEEEEVDNTLQELEEDVPGYFTDNEGEGWGWNDSTGDDTGDRPRDGGVQLPQRRDPIPEAVQIQETEYLS